jgi:hypothetical protein
MFSWFHSMGLKPFVALLREFADSYSLVIPRWVYFSLPNALWLFGGIQLFYSIWEDACLERLFWVLLFSTTAVGSEIGQSLGIVPGTYDITDMALMAIFIPLAIAIGEKNT